LDSSSAGTGAEFLVLSLGKKETQSSSATNDRTPYLHGNPTDEALLALLQRGDKEAIGCLFRRFAESVRNIGERTLRDKAEADDLVQQWPLRIEQCLQYPIGLLEVSWSALVKNP
jgi:hypothetical protein